MPADLDELIARLEAASGPDWRLDRDVYRATNPDKPEPKWAFGLPPLKLTASIDAALAIVEEVEPGRSWSLSRDGEANDFEFIFYSQPMRIIAEAKTAPLAILIAILRAKKGQSDDK